MPKNSTYSGAKKRYKIYSKAGNQLYSDVAYLKTLINSELHQHFVDQTFTSDNDGVVYSLSSVPQGDGISSRTGNSILPRYLTCHAQIYKNMDASSVNHTTMRVILFQYWGEGTDAGNSAAVNMGDVLKEDNPLSFLNPANTGAKGDRERRIRILRNRMFILDKVTKTSQIIKFNISMNGPKKDTKEHCKFNASNTAEPLSGGLYFLVVDDNSSGIHKNAIILKTSYKFHDN